MPKVNVFIQEELADDRSEGKLCITLSNGGLPTLSACMEWWRAMLTWHGQAWIVLRPECDVPDSSKNTAAHELVDNLLSWVDKWIAAEPGDTLEARVFPLGHGVCDARVIWTGAIELPDGYYEELLTYVDECK